MVKVRHALLVLVSPLLGTVVGWSLLLLRLHRTLGSSKRSRSTTAPTPRATRSS